MFKKIVSVLLFFSLNAFAQESLQVKMQRLQSVSKAERFKLMNEIKRELITLHGDQRREAVSRLRKHMGHRHGMRKHDGSGRGLHRGHGRGQGKYKNQNQQWRKHKNQQQQQKNSGENKNQNQQQKQQPQHGQKNR